MPRKRRKKLYNDVFFNKSINLKRPVLLPVARTCTEIRVFQTYYGDYIQVD